MHRKTITPDIFGDTPSHPEANRGRRGRGQGRCCICYKEVPVDDWFCGSDLGEGLTPTPLCLMWFKLAANLGNVEL